MNEPKKPALPQSLDTRRSATSTAAALRGGAAPRGDSGVLPAGQPEGGFSAMLKHAGLWDLVQLRCESRVRCVVCVTSGRQVGFLYFNEGQIVHAATGGVQGERAVLEILGWTSGTWDSCERPWPTVPTIATSWQGLFLRAAQQQDEAKRSAQVPASQPAQRKSQPQPVSSPVRLASPVPASSSDGAPALRGGAWSGDVAPAPRGGAWSGDVAPALRGGAWSGDVAPALRGGATGVQLPVPPPAGAQPPARREESGVSYRPEDFDHSVRMNARGAIVTGHGAVEAYAELAAYCCRLGDLLGDLLGMGKLQAIDASLRGGVPCFVVREAGGDTVTLRPRPDADANAIRAQLNLP